MTNLFEQIVNVKVSGSLTIFCLASDANFICRFNSKRISCNNLLLAKFINQVCAYQEAVRDGCREF